ncbi:MAG: glycosyltransferase family 39 protein [Chloroflexi bacterium]|nr:glycosyltransferase family 39 protein [Chloroflexota bacterium]
MKRFFLLFALSLIFNLLIASFLHAPNYLDDAYYYGGALRLAQGQGFTEPYVWNYLDSPTSLPRPSYLYWMPLTSIIAALPMMIFGQNFFIARLPFIIIASLLPLITYHVSLITANSPRHALASSLITLFSGFYPIFFATTDSFALYAFIVSLTFIALYRGIESNQKRWCFFAGIGVGLAHLTRADGLLLLIVVLIVAIFPNQKITPSPLHLFTFSLLGYFLITTPWLIRNLTLTGSPFGASGMATLWLVEYNDLFNYPTNISFARYLNAGIVTILRGKLDALLINTQTIIAVQCLIFLAPLVTIGLWKLRTHALYRIVILYAGLLYAAMTFAFSFVGARGGLFHSGAALLPFYIPASLVGLDIVIDWIAARRSTSNGDQAKKFFSIAMTGFAALLTLIVISTRAREWNSVYDHYQKLQTLTPADAVVISNNPPLVWVAANRSGAMIPNGDESMLLKVAEQFKARYVLMDKNHVAQLDSLYKEGKGESLKLVSEWSEYKLFEVTR